MVKTLSTLSQRVPWRLALSALLLLSILPAGAAPAYKVEKTGSCSAAEVSEAVKSGALAALHEGGATWFPASTGANQAVNMGAMAEGETMISTHVRNFPGRNGSAKAQMFLASALSVAAAATAGKITDPREFL